MSLSIKPKDDCRWDLVSLGEVMLRFDPGEYRIWTTRRFEVSYGDGGCGGSTERNPTKDRKGVFGRLGPSRVEV
jgi:hypothetical protein